MILTHLKKWAFKYAHYNRRYDSGNLLRNLSFLWNFKSRKLFGSLSFKDFLLSAHNSLGQWFSPFLTRQPFNTDPRVVMTPNHKVTSLLPRDCNLLLCELQCFPMIVGNPRERVKGLFNPSERALTHVLTTAALETGGAPGKRDGVWLYPLGPGSSTLLIQYAHWALYFSAMPGLASCFTRVLFLLQN